MLIKSADPDSSLAQLEALLRRPDLSEAVRKRGERELRMARRGQRAERDAQYEIEFHFGSRQDVATIHGLRIEHRGRVAQIDHLIMTRFLDIWVCESKAYTGRIAINDFGEWEVAYGHRSYGIKSPVLQAWNQMNVLADLFATGPSRLTMESGTRLKPTFKIAVLFSDAARISRPIGASEHLEAELRTVMKVERLYATFERSLRERANGGAGGVSTEELARLAKSVAALHKPLRVDWSAVLGLEHATAAGAEALDPAAAEAPENVVVMSTETCAACRVRLRPRVVRYCRELADVFGGRLYCYRCQPAHRARATS